MMSQWDDLGKRLATICIGVPILWILWLDEFWRVLFWEGTHLVVAYEWTQMAQIDDPFWGFIVSSLTLIHSRDTDSFLLLLLVSTALLTLSKTNTTAYFNGWMLVTLPFRTWIALASGTNGLAIVVTLLLTVWNCDTGALLIGRLTKGRLLGAWAKPLRRRLVLVSPKKSIEGLLGGVVFGTCTYVFMPWLWIVLDYVNIPAGNAARADNVDVANSDILIGLLLSIAAILGDLWESALKRTYQVKDTGKLLPGHGGILDRFDSSLLAVVLYKVLIEKQVVRP